MDLTEEQALAEWKKGFIKSGWTRPNEIKVENKMTIDDENAKTIINPKFGKAFMYWTEVSKLDAEETLEFQDEVIPNVTEFLPAKIRTQILTPFDNENKPIYKIAETDPFKDICIVDQDDNVIYEGPYTGELYDKYKVRFAHVLYVYVKRPESPLDDSILFRWALAPSSGKNWSECKKLLDKAGRPMTFKVAGVEEGVNGSNKYNILHFAVGSAVPPLTAVNAMKQVNLALAGKTNKELPAGSATPHAALAPSFEPKKEVVDVDYNSPLTDPKVKKAKEKEEMAKAVENAPEDLPFP